MKPEPKLLIALESIPRVIGERQFRMLCEALEIDELLFERKAYEDVSMSREEYFAKMVEGVANGIKKKRLRSRQTTEGTL
ncbi:hypothetical protein [Brucella sp. BO2]|uniref:hypothetical protein n=1 Tax=Brucella sp. BO2 TaxID=693750 RepID=UPI00046D5779|nr:hypothetical protein [Brucella sp. BO2]